MIYPGIFFDIETGKSARAEEFMPEFKEPKIKKDGQPYANSKSIAEQVEEWEADCALSPITGRILCIGYAYEHGERIIAGADDENEEFILRDFWKKYSDRDLLYLVGWNINRFDLPFIY